MIALQIETDAGFTAIADHPGQINLLRFSYRLQPPNDPRNFERQNGFQILRRCDPRVTPQAIPPLSPIRLVASLGPSTSLVLPHDPTVPQILESFELALEASIPTTPSAESFGVTPAGYATYLILRNR